MEFVSKGWIGGRGGLEDRLTAVFARMAPGRVRSRGPADTGMVRESGPHERRFVCNPSVNRCKRRSDR